MNGTGARHEAFTGWIWEENQIFEEEGGGRGVCEINYKIWAQPGTASGWGPPISIIGGVQHLMHIVGHESEDSE